MIYFLGSFIKGKPLNQSLGIPLNATTSLFFFRMIMEKPPSDFRFCKTILRDFYLAEYFGVGWQE